MNIKIDEQNRITGYATVGGFVGGIEVEAGEEAFEDFAPGKYLWRDGGIVENPDYTPPVPTEPDGPDRDPFEALRETVDMLVIQMLGGK